MRVMATQIGDGEVRKRSRKLKLFWLIPSSAAAGVAIIAATLWVWGAKEVRGDAGAVLFLTFVGIVWLVVAHALFPWLGLSIRDDAFDRNNHAAAVALACALISVALTFAAGNLGEGPSYWENVFCAALATGGLFVLWILMELFGRISVSIAEERDVASGVRFGGLLLAWGLILGRATTGNWHSCDDSLRSFLRDGWVAAILLLPALVVELLLKPSRLRPFPSWIACGVMPAIAYLVAAAIWLWRLGRWEGMP